MAFRPERHPFTLALLRAAGLQAQHVRSLTLHLAVGEHVTVTAVMDANGPEMADVVKKFTLSAEPVETPQT